MPDPAPTDAPKQEPNDRTPPEDWFARLSAAVPELDATIGPEERDALLDLARVAAHTSERWTAPLTTFLLGVAFADMPPGARGDRIRGVTRALSTG